MTEEKPIENVVSGGPILGSSQGPIHPVFRLLLSIVVLFAAYLAAGLFAGMTAASPRVFDLVFRPLFLAFLLAGFCFLLKTADEVDGSPFTAMGLSIKGPWLRDASSGLLIGFLLISIAYVVIRLTCQTTATFHLSAKAGKLLLAEVVILSTGAMAEEVAFRGYPFQRLVDVMNEVVRWLVGKRLLISHRELASNAGPFVAAVVWSCAFGAVHAGNPGVSVIALLNTAFVGILFCLAYFRTRSLWMPWGIHFAWNAALGVVFGLPVSGLRDFSVVVRTRVQGPAWISGGNYGIEGSVLGTSVIVIGIVLVQIFVTQRGQCSAAMQIVDAERTDNDRLGPESIQS